MVAHKSQAPRLNTANVQTLPMCPRCQCTFHVRMGLVGHLRTQCKNIPITLTSAKPASDPTTTTIQTTDNNFSDAPQPTITDTILLPPPSAPITVTNPGCPTPTTSVATSDYLPPAASNITTALSTSDGDSVLTCPHCDHTFTNTSAKLATCESIKQRLVNYCLEHQQNRDRHLQCPHCPHTFTHRMGLLGHMRIQVSGIHRDANKSCAPINTSYSPPMSSTTSTSSRAQQTQHLPTYLVLIVIAHAHHASA
ncbi:unnamed protein product [Schistocephalus solidus]|uniref:C2H2-type domain-containing protein n=1 Tax=Schistocephalus solidus TaxID=70667 RepID=A0A183SMZ2_SCHSO|nr:unnamed protein product [Schistocephalus solidus]